MPSVQWRVNQSNQFRNASTWCLGGMPSPLGIFIWLCERQSLRHQGTCLLLCALHHPRFSIDDNVLAWAMNWVVDFELICLHWLHQNQDCQQSNQFFYVLVEKWNQAEESSSDQKCQQGRKAGIPWETPGEEEGCCVEEKEHIRKLRSWAIESQVTFYQEPKRGKWLFKVFENGPNFAVSIGCDLLNLM